MMTYIQLDWEEAVLEWEETDKLEAQVQWRRGDIALALKPVYGEHTLDKFAETVGVDYDTIHRYRQVAKAYEYPTRIGNLSWSHHQCICIRENRLEWLQKASEARPKWSVSQMLEEIAADDERKAEEIERQQRAEAFKRRLEVAGILERWKPGENDDEMLEVLAQIQEQERKERAEAEARKQQVRIASKQLAQAIHYISEILATRAGRDHARNNFDNRESDENFTVTAETIKQAAVYLQSLSQEWES
jgi:hypothetical protein